MSAATTMAVGAAEPRIIRHHLVDRLFHWIMAAATFALLATGLSVALGWEFAWLEIHWVAGLVLTAVVVLHIVRASIWQPLSRMWIPPGELAANVAHPMNPPKPGKYSVAQRLMHHAVTVFSLTAIVSGLLMLKRVNQPLVLRDPYWLSAETWGWVYVLHGLAALVFVSLIILHVYFAIRPEKLFYLRSMILGWITPQELEANHDPRRWSGDGAA